jgi:hypothetical protein
MLDYYTSCSVCGNNFHVTSPQGAFPICNVCKVRRNARHLAMKKKRLSIGDIKELNRKAGQHWFSPDTMRFFKSKIPQDHVGLVNNRYFITSEKSPWDKRKYSIREWLGKSKTIETVGDFGSFNTKSQAERKLKKMMQEMLKN